MHKAIFIFLGLLALFGPIALASKISAQPSTLSFSEFYPLLVSGGLLSLVFFLASVKFNTKNKSSS